MTRIINYRVGDNNSNEIFDFSLYQLIKGMSAMRITISFFKPVLAAAIYYHYLGDIISPVVLDPCAGFGGRLLGFKSRYPEGTYIGIEPNKDTYKELLQLVELGQFKNVKLYNCKFEDFNLDSIKYDFAFTSITYYNKEKYSNSEQISFDDWKNTFITKILTLKNGYINLPDDLYSKLNLMNVIDAYISTRKTHFSKTNSNKKELIIKI